MSDQTPDPQLHDLVTALTTLCVAYPHFAPSLAAAADRLVEQADTITQLRQERINDLRSLIDWIDDRRFAAVGDGAALGASITLEFVRAEVAKLLEPLSPSGDDT